MENKDLRILADEEVVALAQSGDKLAYEFLIDKYKSIAKVKSQTYFIIGADHEDVIQEGMIGIFKAIRDYDSSKKASFKTFAELCITRQIVAAIQRANRQKHQILNESVSLNPLGDTYDMSSEPLNIRERQYDIISPDMDPEDTLLMKEIFNYIRENESEIFSPMEVEVWYELMSGKNYREIAENMEKEPKIIDNAVQRIKKKVHAYLQW
ncbi:MAG: RNA polymerase sporulation sigma factor SigH [Firmicutes bacterium]|nr:RNA polymerase sporulation sigma factor SigH [Bacillota bacterium]